MANQKISALTALTAAGFATNDEIPIVDTSAIETKKTTIADFDTRFAISANPVGATPNANAISLTGQAITLQPANGSFPGVLTAADWTTFNNKQDTGLALLLAGGTMSGPIAMGSSKITGLADGTATGDAIHYGQRGANNGVASLDGGGKVPVTQLPSSVMTYEGTWNASTNAPTLIDGTGDAGMVYLVSVAGTQDLGSGSISYSVGDWVIYNGTIWEKSSNSSAVVSVNGNTGVVTVNAINELTGDVTAGPASGSASAAATLANTGVTPGVYTSANITVDPKGRITAAANGTSAPTFSKEVFVLVAGDITNQYIDLLQVATTNSIDFVVKDGGIQIEGASYDYSVNYTGGAGGKTRITFLNDLATGGGAALVATDVVVVKYTY